MWNLGNATNWKGLYAYDRRIVAWYVYTLCVFSIVCSIANCARCNVTGTCLECDDGYMINNNYNKNDNDDDQCVGECWMSLVKFYHDVCVCIVAHTPEEEGGDDGLSGGAIFGIILACIAGLLVLILIIIAIIIGIHKNRRSSDATDG